MSLIDFLKEKAQGAVGVEVDVEGRAVVLSPERSAEILVAAIRTTGAPLREHWLGADRLHFVMTHSSGVQASGEIVEIDLALLANTWEVTAVLGKPVDVHHEHIIADAVVRLVASLLRAAPDAFGGAKLKETRLALWSRRRRRTRSPCSSRGGVSRSSPGGRHVRRQALAARGGRTLWASGSSARVPDAAGG